MRAAPPPSPASPPAGSEAMRGERCRPCLGGTKQELPRPWSCTRVPRSIPPVHGRRPCRNSGHEAAACTRLLGERRLAPSMYWSKASNPHPWLVGERKGKEREWWVEIEDEEIRQSSWWDLHVGGSDEASDILPCIGRQVRSITEGNIGASPSSVPSSCNLCSSQTSPSSHRATI
jgi:hypothetical protein